ncbi:MAG: acyl-CoA thioesterase [Spirochaetes bacterium]|nr:acyl-CoA thioesterase [Spirochaetota bacterium]
MKPKPFKIESYKKTEQYVTELSTGLVWHKCRHRTLYADTDRSRVVYHSNYLRYFELGRASLMRDANYPYFDIEESGYVYPIIDQRIQYFRALYYDDLMYIYTRPDELHRVKLQFNYVITHAESGDISCMGYTKHCALNNSGIPVAVDPKTVELWKNFPK